MVEQGVFPKKAVRDLLNSDFVEARLNTDLPESHPHYKFNERIQGLRATLLGKDNPGLPQYFVADPNNIERPLIKRSGAAGVDKFVSFFKRGITKAAERGEKGGG